MLLHQTKKKVTFPLDWQNSSELSDNNNSMTEITPIPETYEQNLKLFRCLKLWNFVNFPDINQPLAQTVSYHNEIQPMSTQQKVLHCGHEFSNVKASY